jgi:hypothetical protein
MLFVMIEFLFDVSVRCVIPVCIFVIFTVQVWRRVYCVVVKFTLYIQYIHIFCGIRNCTGDE